MLKIQNDVQEKGNDQDWSGLKADVFSIELQKWDDQRHQLWKTYIDEFKNLM